MRLILLHKIALQLFGEAPIVDRLHGQMEAFLQGLNISGKVLSREESMVEPIRICTRRILTVQVGIRPQNVECR